MVLFDLFPPIAKHPIFQGTDRDTVNRFLNERTMTVVRLGVGSTAYASDGQEDRIGLLLRGTAQAFTGPSKENALLKTIRSGELFGIANLFAEDEPFPSRIVAISDCEILWIERDALKALIEQDPVVLRCYLSFQSKKILYLNRKIAILTAGSAEKKLAVCLLDYEDGGVFTPNCSMSELAELLGMGRASLYRAIDNLARYGWIEKRDRQLVILDKDALERFL